MEETRSKPTDLKAVIQEVWESLNGCLYDLDKGNIQDAQDTINDLIALLERAGAN